MAHIPNNLGPFQFEPRYTEEEVRERRRRRNQLEQQANRYDHNHHDMNRRERELQDRLDGVIPITDWCQCGFCRVPQNPTRPMCNCCHEQTILDEKRGDIGCIINHPDFRAVCLTPAVLRIVVNSMEEVRGYGININDWTNRLYRLVGYRAYTYWVHQRLGRYNRKVTPACVVIAIRDAFPEDNEDDYVSYKEADEVGDAWHL